MALVSGAPAPQPAHTPELGTDEPPRHSMAAPCPYHASLAPTCALTPTPEVGAQCGNPARWDLCGGPPARAVPTATGSGRNAGPGHGLRRRASLPDRSGSPHRMPHCHCRGHRRPRRRYSARDRAGRLRRASPTATTYSSSYARPALLTGSSIATSAPTTSRFLLCRTSWHGAGSAPAGGAGGSVRS